MKKQNLTILIIILSSICYKIKAQPYNAVGLTPSFIGGLYGISNFTASNDTMYFLTDQGISPNTYHSIIKYDGTNWALLDTFSTTGCLNNNIYSFQYFQGELYIGGDFQSVRGVPNTKCIFAWNNGVFHEVGGGFNCGSYGTKVFALTAYQNKLIVLGHFLDGVNDYCLLSWDGVSYSNMGAFTFIGGVCEPRWISSLKVYNNELYVCGRFNAINGIQNYFNIAKFDGITNSWTTVNNLYPDPNTHTYKPSLEFYNNEIYFLYNLVDTVTFTSTYYLRKWNGISWTLIEQSQMDTSCAYYSNGIINSLKTFNNEFFLGGHSSSLNGIKVLNNSNGWNSFNNLAQCPNIHTFIEFKNKLYFIGNGAINGGWFNLGYYDPSTTSVQVTQFNNEINAFPNPAKSLFEISFETSSNEHIEINLYNSLGSQVYFSNEQTTARKFSKEINVENLPNGIYFLEVKTKEGVFNKKVVIQH